MSHARVGQITDFDKLTSKSGPTAACAARGIPLPLRRRSSKDQLDIFINFEEIEEEKVQEEAGQSEKLQREPPEERG